MIDKLFDNFKQFVKIKPVTVDGPIFNLHCKLTTLILLVLSCIITTNTYVGKPIQCISDVEKKEFQKVIDTACWIKSTFIMPQGRKEEKYYAYYQWVCFVLLLQCLAFYFPKWLWKQTENNLMSRLAGSERIVMGKKKRKIKRTQLVNYMMQRLEGHREYAIMYWFCELYCLFNVLLQIYLLNMFFEGDFYTYGLDVLGLMNSEVSDMTAMDYVFPLTTKCKFSTYGPSGTIQTYDVFCILPLNNFNRYSYMFLWFWFVILAALLLLLILYRILLLVSSTMRCVLLKTPGKSGSNYETRFVVHNVEITDWWILYQLKSNVDSVLFGEIIEGLYRMLKKNCVTSPLNVVTDFKDELSKGDIY